MTLSQEKGVLNGGGHVNGNGVTDGHVNRHVFGTGFTVRDTPVENLRPLKVVVVGAGFSGILAAIRIPERLRNVELTVYEKNEGVGGVWWLNKYPGVACDVPSHSYQYTFAPNNWSDLYAPGSEIRAYLEGVAERFGATRFIKTSHRVDHCEWNEKEKKWTIKVKNLTTDETFDDTANILVMARGQLSDLRWPDIPGMDTFQGAKMHSSSWDTSYDFRNKRIGIIGNGSSAIQIIPQLQKIEGTSLTCFMRSPTWISPRFGDQGMIALGLDPDDTAFPDHFREKLTTDPQFHLRLRKVFEDDGNLLQDTTKLGSPMQRAFQALFRDGMQAKLAAHPDLAALMIPSFAPGCRRVTPGRGFLEALGQPNVRVLFDGSFPSGPVAKVTPTGIIPSAAAVNNDDEEKEKEIPLDVIVTATGFSVATAPPFPVLGRDRLPLSTRWKEHPSSYLSLAVDSFPNMFLLFGPNSAIGFGSLTKILEAEVDYLLRYIRKMQKEDYVAMEPKQERVQDFVEYTDAYFKATVYMDECRSWYARGGRVVGLWPGSTLHALEALRAPRWEDWVYTSVDEEGSGEGKGKRVNMLAWLGNGASETQDQESGGDPSWYLNPEEVEMPVEKRPEENPRFRARPWSH